MNGQSYEVPQMAPHSQQAEEAVLGSIFINPDAYFEVSDFLTPDDFFILRNGWVFEAMQRIYRRGDDIGLLLAIEELKAQGRLDDIGGGAYLTYLGTVIGTSVHAEALGRVVKHAAVRRRGLEASGEATQLFRDEDRPIADIEADVRQMYDDVFAELPTANEPSNLEISEAAHDRIFDDVEDTTSIGFGLHELDKLLSRATPGTLAMILARTGRGKSRYVSQRALAEAQAGRRVLFLTTEEAEFQTWYRLIEMASNGVLQVRDMNAREPIRNSPERIETYIQCDALLSGLPLDIVRVTGWHIHQVIRRMGRQHYDLVVVDHLHRIAATPSQGEQEMRSDQEIAHRVYLLKNAAITQETVVMLPAQVKPGSEKKGVYRASDIKESDAAGEHPDVIIGLHRGENSGSAATVCIGKSRWGDADGRIIDAYFDMRSGTFEDPPQHMIQPPALATASESSIF